MKLDFSIFKRGLEKTATKVTRSIASLFTGVKIHDVKSFDELEAMLISADFGVSAASRVTKDIKDKYQRGLIATDADLSVATKESVTNILRKNSREISFKNEGTPKIILMVGVNGSGKTTTIGKLAYKLQKDGKKVMMAACDTFRAAAVEQLKLWGEKTNCTVISAKHGADPASVAYDATSAAVSRNVDVLLIDTAGRQHNQKALMDELAKICRSISKVCPGAPHEVWLTVDASLGANVLNQAREFSNSAGVTGLVLTKLDGTGRGGMVVALHQEFELPTFFIGLGEQPDDLQYFDAEYYSNALFGEDKNND